VNLNQWLINIKYFGDEQNDEINLHAILNHSRDNVISFTHYCYVIAKGPLAL